MKKILICGILSLMLVACGHDHVIRFNLAQQQNFNFVPQQNMSDEPSYEGRSHFFFWGMWQKTNYDLTKVCPTKGIKAIETHWTWYDSLVGSLLTMGIYSPESFSIYCN